MNTALDKLLAAIEGDRARRRYFISFVFRYGGFEFDYMGRYYAYVYEGSSANTATEDEYGWGSYEEMLDAEISQTGKTVRAMLAELPAHALEIEFDVPLPEIKTEDEIRLLRDSLDNMQRSLSQYIDELTETTAQKASMESELDVAKEIQMSMVPMTWPAFPDRDDIDMFGELTPARAVGGDLYDFCLRDGRLYFCVGDVSGKGVPASLVMVVISSMFRTLLTSVDAPDRLMSIINTSMSARNENQMFVTLFVGELDLETGVLRYCNAGHNAPVILKNGVSRFLEADANVPVGIVSDWQYSLQTTKLPVGDVLFLYTDGLSEAAREDGSFFGDERILSSLAGHQDGSSQSLVHHMANAVRSFVGEAEQSDDLTMLAIKRCQSSSSKEKMASAGLPK